jgi:hypothetical protein
MSPLRPASDLLKHVYQALCLVMLLVAGQQGAVLHELGHLTAAHAADASAAASSETTDSACPLCPMFAQIATPAFSHTFVLPALLRVESGRIAEPRDRTANAAVPSPRCRGPPFLS